MITHVAILYKCKVYSLPAPNRHHNVIRTIPGGVKGWEIQGFIDDQNNFLTRKQAYFVASVNDQILPRKTNEYNGDELYSEDLW